MIRLTNGRGITRPDRKLIDRSNANTIKMNEQNSSGYITQPPSWIMPKRFLLVIVGLSGAKFSAPAPGIADCIACAEPGACAFDRLRLHTSTAMAPSAASRNVQPRGVRRTFITIPSINAMVLCAHAAVFDQRRFWTSLSLGEVTEASSFGG